MIVLFFPSIKHSVTQHRIPCCRVVAGSSSSSIVIEPFLPLVEPRAFMKSVQALPSPAIPFTLSHDLPVFLISSSTVLRYILLVYPFFLHFLMSLHSKTLFLFSISCQRGRLLYQVVYSSFQFFL